MNPFFGFLGLVGAIVGTTLTIGLFLVLYLAFAALLGAHIPLPK